VAWYKIPRMAKDVAAIRRWGTSRAVVISRRVQKQLSWPLREVIHVSVENDAIVMRPINLPASASIAMPAAASNQARS